MTRCCLTLLCAPELEEKLLDLLLVEAPSEVFTSAPSFTHGLHPQHLDPVERVLGRGHSMHIQLLLEQATAEALLGRLRSQLAGTGVRYWLLPVLDEGEIA